MRTLRLKNKTDKPLRICVEPNPDFYDLGPGDTAEMKGFDPQEDVFDFFVGTDPEGSSVLVCSFTEIAVFVSGRRLARVPNP